MSYAGHLSIGSGACKIAGWDSSGAEPVNGDSRGMLWAGIEKLPYRQTQPPRPVPIMISSIFLHVPSVVISGLSKVETWNQESVSIRTLVSCKKLPHMPVVRA